MTAFEMIPVLARVTRDNDVEVCELRRMQNGDIGVPARAFYFRLGRVTHRKVRVHVDGRSRIRDEWTWLSEGYQGSESTKEECVTAMLTDAGYIQVEIEATIPPLF